MKLKNTLTGTIDSFTPKTDTVTLYACGPTVYGDAHLGNLRAAVIFDTLVRVLKTHWPVQFARNITDVDDKIIKAAQTHFPHLPIDAGIAAVSVPATQAWHEANDRLGALRPDFEPRATDYIGPMITMVEDLIARSHAYAADGHVFFDSQTLPDDLRGVLSGRKILETAEAELYSRLETINRHHPADFVLWKPSDDTMPGWDSPWGRGRPGWHLECSAMSRALFGDSFDIHAGGQDLIFPHHENEIAQSACSCDSHEVQAHTWVHTGMLVVNGTKMSKSLGNVVTLNTLALPGSVVRLALLGTHYRSTLDWTDSLLEQTLKRWTRYAAVENDGAGVPDSVADILDNDLNTPGALAEIDRLIDTNTPGAWASLDLLGLWDANPYWRIPTETETLITTLMAQRSKARDDKDWATADAVRDTLLDMGVEIRGNDWVPTHRLTT